MLGQLKLNYIVHAHAGPIKAELYIAHAHAGPIKAELYIAHAYKQVSGNMTIYLSGSFIPRI